jgi:hypothetical protein
LGYFLVPGGQLVVKDIDFGTMRFSPLASSLLARVKEARRQWEIQRMQEGFVFEDSWVGSKLANYLRAAGYENVQEQRFVIRRQAPLTPEMRTYLQGIGTWFVCENPPHLLKYDRERWLQSFLNGEHCLLDQETFFYEETEFLVTGTWTGHSALRSFKKHFALLEAETIEEKV